MSDTGCMNSIWIVDDEVRQCRGLTNLMRQTYPDCKVSYFTEPHAAVAALEHQSVGLLITDIRMPLMDGLALSAVFQRLSPQTQIILLTGYADFSYAQKAVSLGVFDYLLKPLDYDELVQTVLRVQQKMQKSSLEERERQALKHKLTQALPIYEDQTLNQWALGMLPVEDCSPAVALLQQERQGYVVALAMRKPKGISPEALDTSMELALQAGRRLWRHRHNALFFKSQLRDDRILVLVTTRLTTEKEAAHSLKLDALVRCIHTDTGQDLVASLGCLVPDLGSQVQASYRTATDALDFGFYLGWNTVIYSHELLPKASRFGGTSLAEEDFLREAIRSADKSVATAQMDIIFQRFISYGYPNPLELKQGVLSLLRRLSQFTRASFSAEEWALLQEIMEEDLLSALDYTTLRHLTHGFLETMMYATCRNEAEAEEALLGEFWSYLEKHYHHDIALDEIAAHFALTPNYFSNLITKITGQGFVKSLNSVRLQNAKKLLGDSEQKIYEIAISTGFRDARYFTRVFKQSTGITPEQYRQQLTEGETLT